MLKTFIEMFYYFVKLLPRSEKKKKKEKGDF